ncbi:MAG: right-handed parallel beta-helix repeat-containing protein, partial [Planctomycetota bacterium]
MSWYRSSLIVAVVGLSVSAQAATIYVDDDAGPGGDGLTWATAYRFLQDALADAAASGGLVTEIRVAQGTHTPDRDEAGNITPGDRDVSFQLVSGLAVRGGYAGVGAADPDERDVDTFETVLSGDLLDNDGPDFLNNDENSWQVLNALELTDAELDGLTVTSGSAQGKLFDGVGGGLYADASALDIAHCTFRDNSSDNHGGAIYLDDTLGVVISDCVFENNRSLGGPGAGGGGIAGFFDTDTVVSGCEFTGNSAGNVGGGIAVSWSYEEVPAFRLADCTFTDNTAARTGGGAFLQDLDATVVDCMIRYNTVPADSDLGWGGGLQTSGVTLVVNSVISGNSVPVAGGGIFVGNNDELTVVNCSIGGNHADDGGGVYLSSGATAAIQNSIVWGNTAVGEVGEPAQIFIEDADPTYVSLDYSDVQGLTGDLGGTGNIDADPMFADPDNGDFRLSAGSPCIDAGDNTAVPGDIATDLAGNPRFVDDPDTVDTGDGDPPIVDMGAYEFQGLPCPWDLDGDSNVFVTDLLMLLANWGPCDGCPADFNDDGIVNVLDLLALIANFGPCPGSPCVWDVTGDGVVDNADLQQVLDNLGPCDGCPEDVNGDGMVDGQDAAAVAT